MFRASFIDLLKWNFELYSYHETHVEIKESDSRPRWEHGAGTRGRMDRFLGSLAVPKLISFHVSMHPRGS